MRRGLISAALLAAAFAAGAGPADMILAIDGVVFVDRAGTAERVSSVPFTLEPGDVVRVNPGGQARLLGGDGEGSLVITPGRSPHTVGQPTSLIATLLSQSPSESADVAGVDFTTMRSAIHLSQQLASPRNTALRECPTSLVIALPAGTAREFIAASQYEGLSATVTLAVLGAEESLFAGQVQWSRSDLQGLASSDREEDLRTVELGEAVGRIPAGQRVVAHVSSPQLQDIALRDDATEPPPEDRAWFRVLTDDERLRAEADLEHALRIAERLGNEPTQRTLFCARVLESHGLSAETLALLRESLRAAGDGASGEALAPLARYEQRLSATLAAPWQPESR